MSELNKEALLEEIKGLIKNSTENAITEKELNAKVDEINNQLKALNEKEDNHEDVKTLKESVEKLLSATSENAAAIKSMTEQKQNNETTPKTFREAIKAAIMEKRDIVLTEKEDDYGKRLSLKDYFTEKGGNQTPTYN